MIGEDVNIKKSKNSKFYIGLDIGTNSVGFCATDGDYNLIRVCGKDLWGSRLFEAAQTAKDRRQKRSARRTLQRKKERILLLQGIFQNEIMKVDRDFFARLHASSYWEDDKEKVGIFSRNSIFFDDKICDKSFYKKYPTIYHLRSALLQNPAEDIRFLYLAIHHILKNRGHFINEDSDIFSSNVKDASLTNKIKDMNTLIEQSEEFGFLQMQMTDLEETKLFELDKKISKEKLSKSQLEKEFNNIFGGLNSNQKALLKAISGNTVNAKSIFTSQNKNAEENSIEINEKIDSFAVEDDVYEEFLMKVEEVSSVAGQIIEILKDIYSYIVYRKILGEEEYISNAFVKRYENHKKQLKEFKKLIKDYYPEYYRDMFNVSRICEKGKSLMPNGYAKYINGSNYYTAKKEISDKCTRVDFYKYVTSILDKKPEYSDIFKWVKDAIEQDNFLLKLRTNQNTNLPYQVNEKELKKILEVSAQKFAFLNEIDESGLSTRDKILSILTYRIPYYVGPLGSNGDNVWMQRILPNEKILPWNFNEVVDLDKSEMKFIERMQNSCTYISGAKVLPKNSLLYQEYMVLQDLNNLRINGERLNNSSIKTKIIDDLYKKYGKVTIKMLKSFIKNDLNLFSNNDNGFEIKVSGVTSELSSNLNIYKNFNKIFDGKIEDNINMCEDIIARATVVSDKKRLKKWLMEEYGNSLSQEQINSILGLKISGWGNFSREFLDGIKYINHTTGQVGTIIEIMRKEPLNLQEILFKFEPQDIDVTKNIDNQKEKIIYEDVNGLYCSPSVKRGIWQSVNIVDELVKIVGKKPDKIFVEVTRRDEENPSIKESRKFNLSQIYKNIGAEYEKVKNQLEKVDEKLLGREEFLLYFTQLGKCMYSGKEINIDLISNYQKDHIYPQSKIADDSIDNKVLVESVYNQNKSDREITPEIIQKMSGFWKMLHSKGLISTEKLNRLINGGKISDEEMSMFLKRQIVTTDQSVKAVIELFKDTYGDKNVVYSKAKNVSLFRKLGYVINSEYYKNYLKSDTPYQESKALKSLKDCLVKCRELNDLHHAKDAYLNIVVGNVLDEKFTKKYFYYDKLSENYDKSSQDEKEKKDYRLKHAFYEDIPNVFVSEKHIPIIQAVLEKNTPMITYLTRQSFGKYYKETIWGADKHQKDYKNIEEIKAQFSGDKEYKFDGGNLPLKSDKNLLSETLKYGHLSDPTYSYFCVVEYTQKGVKNKAFVAVPLLFAKNIKNNNGLEKFANSALGASDAKVIVRKINPGSILKIGSGYFKLNGNTGNRLKLSNFNPLFVPVTHNQYIKNLFIYNKIRVKGPIQPNENGDIELNIGVNKAEKLTKSQNLEIYNLLIKYFSLSIFDCFEPIKIIVKLLKENKEKFMGLSIEEQVATLINMINLVNDKNPRSLKNIGGVENPGVLAINKKIDKELPMSIVFCSSTGFYKKEIKIN